MSNAQDSPEGWGRASRGYSEKVAPVLMSAFTTEFAERLELSPDTRVIEVGAGSGALTEKLFPMAKSVHATDYSEAMIDVLSERMQALGADNVTCDVMDGQNLEVSDNSYDASASSFAIMLFPDRSPFLHTARELSH